jgi:hypothetical protein
MLRESEHSQSRLGYHFYLHSSLTMQNIPLRHHRRYLFPRRRLLKKLETIPRENQQYYYHLD